MLPRHLCPWPSGLRHSLPQLPGVLINDNTYKVYLLPKPRPVLTQGHANCRSTAWIQWLIERVVERPDFFPQFWTIPKGHSCTTASREMAQALCCDCFNFPLCPLWLPLLFLREWCLELPSITSYTQVSIAEYFLGPASNNASNPVYPCHEKNPNLCILDK